MKVFDYIHTLLESPKKTYNPKIANEYMESYRDTFFNENIVSEITNKMQDELSGGFDAMGVKIHGKLAEENASKIQSATSSYVSKELLRKQIRIIISIDDLDKSWLSSSAIRYDFINALLEAFKELLDIKSVKILISIRTDIIMGLYKNSLRQEEKDQSLIYAISWNKKEIRRVLDNRVNHLIKNQYQSKKEVTFADVFDFKVGNTPAVEYIIDRTMLRPRDAINFVNLCLAECDGDVTLKEDIILEAEEKFYSVRKQALTKEWGSIYNYINDYLDSISFLASKTFNITEMKSTTKHEILNYLLNRPANRYEDEGHNARVLEFNELVKVWFTVGVIGIKKTSTLTIYSSFEKPELDITDLNKLFEIHPLFFRA
jgi:hypothetical protein